MAFETILVTEEAEVDERGSRAEETFDRRRTGRISIPLQCKFDWRDYSVRGLTVDVSQGGALIEARVIPREGEAVYLTFRGLPGQPPFLGLALRSAWFCGGPNLGLGRAALRFEGLSEIDRMRLEQLLARKE